MTENESSKFRIRLDDDLQEAPLPEEIENSQIKRLGQRLTFIAVIIPCVIGAVLFFVYMDINKRVGRVHDTGTSEVKNLSDDLESRFTSISTAHDDFKNSLSKQVESLEKTSAVLTSNMKEVVTAIRYIREARKVDNNKIKAKITEIESTLTSIRDTLETVSSDLQAFDNKVSQEIVMISETVDNAKREFQSEISNLASASIDRKALDLAMISQQVHFQETLKQIKASYDENLASLRKRIIDLENKRSMFPKTQKKTVEIPPPAKPPATGTVSPDTPATGSASPESGTIVEQDIN